MCLLQVYSAGSKYSLQGDATALSLAVWEVSSLGAVEPASSLCLGWGGRSLWGHRVSWSFDGKGLRGNLNGRNSSDPRGSSNWEEWARQQQQQHEELKIRDCFGAHQDGCSGCGEN